MEEEDEQNFEDDSHNKISWKELQHMGVYKDNYDSSGKIIRYGMTLETIFQQKMEECRNTLSLASISPVVSLFPKIPRLEYKNPGALLLGFYSIKDMSIDKRLLDRLVEKCERNKDTISITKADIIRYAKLIISILK